MRTEDILAALRRLKVETGSLACMGCCRMGRRWSDA